MPTSLSLATVLEKNRLTSDVPFIALIDVEVVNPANGVVEMTLHVANNPESVVCNGVTYEAGAFDFEVKAESGKQPEVSLSIIDYTQTIQGYMQEYGGGVGSNVTLSIVRGDAMHLSPEISEYFQVIASTAENYAAVFQLGAENAIMSTFPRRQQRRDFCQWRYKSTECGYTGPLATCDMTLQGPNGCNTHGNTINFGGFPGLNSNGNRYV